MISIYYRINPPNFLFFFHIGWCSFKKKSLYLSVMIQLTDVYTPLTNSVEWAVYTLLTVRNSVELHIFQNSFVYHTHTHHHLYTDSRMAFAKTTHTHTLIRFTTYISFGNMHFQFNIIAMQKMIKISLSSKNLCFIFQEIQCECIQKSMLEKSFLKNRKQSSCQYMCKCKTVFGDT